jgi:hypothetical protein
MSTTFSSTINAQRRLGMYILNERKRLSRKCQNLNHFLNQEGEIHDKPMYRSGIKTYTYALLKINIRAEGLADQVLFMSQSIPSTN